MTVRVPPVGFFGVAARGALLPPLLGFRVVDLLGFFFGFSSGGSPVSAARAGFRLVGGPSAMTKPPLEEGLVTASSVLSLGAKYAATRTVVHSSIIRLRTMT